MTLPAVGASTWASGSQVCRGKIGTLMAKASAKARQASNSARPASGVAVMAAMSKVQMPVT